MPDDEPIIIRNPSRRLVPAGIAACVLVMFFPPLALNALHSTAPAKAVLGAVAMLVLVAWFARGAWRSTVEARISSTSLTLRSVKESHYALSQIRRWYFAIPNGLPTQAAPSSNALLFILLEDGTRFRGEVTQSEAATLRDRLTFAQSTSAITD